MTPYVLVVEDEDALASLLQYNLDKEGYRVAIATDGEEALMQIDEQLPDLVVLDWMLPKVSGVEVCRRLRARPETRNLPIIMLTARGEETDRIRGLDTGADDYVVKPFSMVELAARIRAVLRRIRPGLAEDRLHHGDIVVDRVAHRVRRADKEIHLGPTEFRLLDYLMQHPGRVFSREQLLNAVWGSDVYVEARTVDVHIGRLRKALNRHRRRPDPHGPLRRLFAGSRRLSAFSLGWGCSRKYGASGAVGLRRPSALSAASPALPPGGRRRDGSPRCTAAASGPVRWRLCAYAPAAVDRRPGRARRSRGRRRRGGRRR